MSLHHLMQQSAAAGAIPGASSLIYPLTYDEDDKDGGNSLTRTALAPTITPEGFMGDGYQTQLKKTSGLPAWLAPGSAWYMSARVKAHRPNRETAKNRDVIVSLCDDATANPMVEIDAYRFGSDAVLLMRTYTSSAQTYLLGSGRYNFACPWPVAYSVGPSSTTARPGGLLFLDATTVLMGCWYGTAGGTQSRIVKIDLTTNTVLGTFTFGSPHRGLCDLAMRSNGDVWCIDYEFSKALLLDLAASFTAGTAVITTTWDVSALKTSTGLDAFDFITVGGTEYAIIGNYHAVSSAYLYLVDTAKIASAPTLALSDRYKRFLIPKECVGLGVRASNNQLYAIFDSAINSYDLATQMGSLSDGGTLVSNGTYVPASGSNRTVRFHPSTDEAWVLCNGITSGGDQAGTGYCGAWRSNFERDGAVERSIRIEYNGSGGWQIYLDSLPFLAISGITPTVTPGALSIVPRRRRASAGRTASPSPTSAASPSRARPSPGSNAPRSPRAPTRRTRSRSTPSP